MKMFRSPWFLPGLVLALVGCSSNEYPLVDDPDRTTSVVLNAQIVGEIGQQPSTWMEGPLPSPSATGQETELMPPSEIILTPGETAELAVALANPPSQRFDVHLRFGSQEEGFQKWVEQDPGVLSNAGQELKIQLPVPESICERLYPVVHQIVLGVQVMEQTLISDVENTIATLDCSIALEDQ